MFECHVTGIPTPTVSWFKDDENIDNSPDYVITKINGACGLKIRKAVGEYSARYTCKATNAGGEAASSARLNVMCKPSNISCLLKPCSHLTKFSQKLIPILYCISYILDFGSFIGLNW